MIAYKFLVAGAVGPFSGYRWPEPTAGAPGEWVDVGGAIRPCVHGIHACRAADLAWWLNDELWRVELAGEVVEDEHGLVARRGRLLERVEGFRPAVCAELSETLAIRSRDRATPALHAAGLGREAAMLAAAPDAASVYRAAEQAEVACERAGAGFAATSSGFAADVGWAAGRDLVRIAIDAAARLAAHAAGSATPGHAEWRFSSSWLAGQLALE